MGASIGNKEFLGKESRGNFFWHLLRGITLWIIWIEHNDKVFNQEQWHESKVNSRIWEGLIMHAKAAWKRVIKHIKISRFSAMALLEGFDKTCDDDGLGSDAMMVGGSEGQGMDYDIDVGFERW